MITYSGTFNMDFKRKANVQVVPVCGDRFTYAKEPKVCADGSVIEPGTYEVVAVQLTPSCDIFTLTLRRIEAKVSNPVRGTANE